jgi:hypothetical protein
LKQERTIFGGLRQLGKSLQLFARAALRSCHDSELQTRNALMYTQVYETPAARFKAMSQLGANKKKGNLNLLPSYSIMARLLKASACVLAVFYEASAWMPASTGAKFCVFMFA